MREDQILLYVPWCSGCPRTGYRYHVGGVLGEGWTKYLCQMVGIRWGYGITS